MSNDPLEDENPEVLRTYASILTKPMRQFDEKTGRSFMHPAGEICEKAAKALRYMAAMTELRSMTPEQLAELEKQSGSSNT